MLFPRVGFHNLNPRSVPSASNSNSSQPVAARVCCQPSAERATSHYSATCSSRVAHGSAGFCGSSPRCCDSACRNRDTRLRATSDYASCEPVPEFNLPLAVELAAAAFEAYLQPVGAEGFQDRTLGGTQITYTNEVFLSEIYQGVLRVELQCANGLRAADFTGASDPYVVMSLGGSTAKSRTKYWTVNPKWDQSFLLYVRDIDQDVLKLQVYDKDFLKPDDDLGVADVWLADMADGKSHVVEADLHGPEATGSIQLRCTFLSFKAAPLVDTMVAGGVVMPEKAPAGTFPNEQEQAKRVEEAVRMYLQNVQRQADGQEPVPAPDTSSGFFGMPDIEAIKQIFLRQVEPILNRASIAEPAPLAADPTTIISSAASDTDEADAGWMPKEKLVQMLKKQVTESLAYDSIMASVSTSSASSSSNSSSDVDDEGMSSPWRVLAAASGRQKHGDCVPVAFIENHDSDTQVWLYRDLGKREAIIAFRGTEQVKWKDIVTDLNMGTVAFDVERSDQNDVLPFTLRVLKTAMPTDEILVHQGFLGAYDSVRHEVFQLLDHITGVGEGPAWKVYVTGHSLGGALATLCAFELSTRQHAARCRQDMVMYSFGAPRVGNKAFASCYNEVVRDSWRVTNVKDIIPSVPRLMGYAHVRHSVQLTPNGLMVQMDSKDVFGEGKSQMEVVKELYTRVTEQRCRWEDIYEEIVDCEMQVLNALINGSALEQHMESYYLQTLQDAVLAAGLTEATKLKKVAAFIKKG